MRKRTDLTPEAEADAAEAFGYYEEQVSGLGHDFLAILEQQLERIGENPLQYQAVHRGVRRAIMRRFPYAVFYIVEGDAAIVLSVGHQARHPDHWRERMGSPK